MTRAVPWLLAACLVAGCSQNMDDQPKYEAQEAAPDFPNRQAARPVPAGTVPWSAQPPRDPAADRYRLERIRRGRQRYDIYCAPCHGLTGDGDGMIPARGFPRPPSLLGVAARRLTDRYLHRVIRDGRGVMFGQGGWIPPADRWSIVAYVRALQLRHEVRLSDLDESTAARVREQLP